MKVLKTILLGESNVGKTSLLAKYVRDTYKSQVPPTVAAEFESKTFYHNGERYSLHVWDTAGQERFRAMMPVYYRSAQAAFLVFDLTNMKSFVALNNWLQELQIHGPDNMDIIIVGNKADLGLHRQVGRDEAYEYAVKHGAIYYETSAESGENINLMFEEIVMKLPGFTERIKNFAAEKDKEVKKYKCSC